MYRHLRNADASSLGGLSVRTASAFFVGTHASFGKMPFVGKVAGEACCFSTETTHYPREDLIMCRFKSGIAVRRGDQVDVLTMPGEDSHTTIREYHKVPEASGGLADRYQTPVEMAPIRGIASPDDYEFVFDAGKPEWWTDSMTDRAKQQLWQAIQDELANGFDAYRDSSSLDLSSLTSAEGLKLPDSVRGYLDLSSSVRQELEQCKQA